MGSFRVLLRVLQWLVPAVACVASGCCARALRRVWDVRALGLGL